MAVRLYAVIFFAGHIGMAMPWSSLDYQSCDQARIAQEKDWDAVWKTKSLDKSPVMVDPMNKKHRLLRRDVRTACIFATESPLKIGDVPGQVIDLNTGKKIQP